mgnify:CR=1 FL=1
MKKEQIQVGCYTIIGDRKSQQDTMQYAWKGDDTVLAVVCDGMGGMSGGERASRKAVDVIFKNFADSFVTDEAQYSEWLKRSFVEADEAVAGLTDEAGNILHSGSTVVGVLIKNNRMYWASAGDSVIYYLDTQGIHTVTRMHNYNLRLEQLLNSGSKKRKHERTWRSADQFSWHWRTSPCGFRKPGNTYESGRHRNSCQRRSLQKPHSSSDPGDC